MRKLQPKEIKEIALNLLEPRITAQFSQLHFYDLAKIERNVFYQTLEEKWRPPGN